ncbi:hypothetical protein D2Q93_16235 [Alicyclobacillaceae bacterium I2511]|nr:hypothetical protein D2Q93_16235 [Alicyclobacillaceae bacterium I2511]
MEEDLRYPIGRPEISEHSTTRGPPSGGYPPEHLPYFSSHPNRTNPAIPGHDVNRWADLIDAKRGDIAMSLALFGSLQGRFAHLREKVGWTQFQN